VTEGTHVKLRARNVSALQHPQHRYQGLDFDICEAKLVCGLEVLCKHIVLLRARIAL
jgi:hypothetical protein